MIRIAEATPKYKPGQLVCHKRYGYRGVIVAADPYCKANDDWYRSNRTQPNRFQPWYHVLVDGANTATYPAEENLEEDPVGLPIEHPAIDVYFTEFKDGRYVRNNAPWEDW